MPCEHMYLLMVDSYITIIMITGMVSHSQRETCVWAIHATRWCDCNDCDHYGGNAILLLPHAQYESMFASCET